MQDELMKVQLKYQKELEKLERDNKELRKQLLLKGTNTATNRKIKVTSFTLYKKTNHTFFAFSFSFCFLIYLCICLFIFICSFFL